MSATSSETSRRKTASVFDQSWSICIADSGPKVPAGRDIQEKQSGENDAKIDLFRLRDSDYNRGLDRSHRRGDAKVANSHKNVFLVRRWML
jgi:hypothetical protein